ncbi:adenine phosphoribosyltransferase Apt [Methanobrevibacter ruminantium M1]|uniref:Hypoxanthine/guanine phosphoribosyltransferase n=1 Tax=Methanobrevibacter ruminantium (strain ATCC 35063 / DSM 1093 / JCM 13430 / OCM 146 / M1) TaxID=634498 RepID=HPRT_METRM|nr:hypoxanthine/guanine phosphoribosyltransferase [Methanobrevibacter ruminantium]D3DYU7.1 RecName: Full=Hypoxanthine/guanine phosphoribosyltransferase; Short=HGPRTase [Methanobrevibacter ruminantium M1]ADC46017.1 adenine phosphoribosyltransferase Apt [Methanobrevibacter ruminantium M1]
MLENLVESLRNAPVVKKGDYDYFVHGISDGIPALNPCVLKEISEVLAERIDLDKVDKIVGVEAMGIHIATALSLETGLPLLVIRKREYGLEGEHEILKHTGYATSKLYINDLNEGDNIVLVDDVVSTGGTLSVVINELKAIGVNILDTFVVVEKGEGKKIVEDKTGENIVTLVKLDVVDGKVVADSLI